MVMAKAPVPGLAKTRLGAVIGMTAAADLAAAALLDTLAACRQAFGAGCHLALDGDITAASRSAELLAALDGWTVFTQEGDSFGDRLAHAHRWMAGRGGSPVVQIGMDTPQVTPELLHAAADGLERGADAVLGSAEDGGWWVLALSDPTRAAVLRDVPMSTPTTYAATVDALIRGGAAVASTRALRDVDTVEDAIAVATAAPGTWFARAWAELVPEAS